MSAQADRIEALMTRLIEQNGRLIELLEAEPAKRTKKAKPFLTDEERQGLYQKWGEHYGGDIAAMDLVIAEALDHDAAKKRGNSRSWSLYVDNWFRTEVAKLAVRQVATPSVKPPDPAEDRSRYDTPRVRARIQELRERDARDRP